MHIAEPPNTSVPGSASYRAGNREPHTKAKAQAPRPTPTRSGRSAPGAHSERNGPALPQALRVSWRATTPVTGRATQHPAGAAAGTRACYVMWRDEPLYMSIGRSSLETVAWFSPALPPVPPASSPWPDRVLEEEAQRVRPSKASDPPVPQDLVTRPPTRIGSRLPVEESAPEARPQHRPGEGSGRAA